ncbi:MAG TPA: RHS repeat-associated core domain-containing protein [Thermoanaerobaculia bacterium]|nr:RHS repeat-associated core domain-containing protein [Thermoanaerobaculia bacterium]
MLRRLLFTFALIVPCSLRGQDAPPPVPQAVKALEHLEAQPNAGPTSWTNGPYTYDEAGNIIGIGSEAFVYDKVGRLKTATVRSPDLSSLQTQSFGYDPYGNLTSTAKLGQTVHLDVLDGTNRLSGIGYDAAGNVITADTLHYEYDALGMLSTVRLGTSAQPRMIYAYTADDERLFAFDVSSGTTHWTLRGLDNKVLRDFKQQGDFWSLERDYVYRDGLLLAALKPAGAVEHYSLDHLGTPRFITDGAGNKIGYHVYWPFGEEWSPGNAQDGGPLKFTGHERDADPSGGATPVDYMHARYYGTTWGRFLSVDPHLDVNKALSAPQRWNRYAYTVNRPINAIDPDGREDQYVSRIYMANNCRYRPCGVLLRPIEEEIKQDGSSAVEAGSGMGEGASGGERLMGGLVYLLLTAKYAAPLLLPGEGTAVNIAQNAAKGEVLTVIRAGAGAMTSAQRAAVIRQVQRATTSETISIVRSANGTVNVLRTRPGVDGAQTFITRVGVAGNTETVQTARNAAGHLVHYDPKGGTSLWKAISNWFAQ